LVRGAGGGERGMLGDVQQKLKYKAVMKCMGGRSAQAIRIYTAQMLRLGGGTARALLVRCAIVLVTGVVRGTLTFFKAEDGIRDWSVTGVQTCALPISVSLPAGEHDAGHGEALGNLVQED